METPDFIPAGTNVEKSDMFFIHFATMKEESLRARWFTPEGRQILKAWEASHFDRNALNALVGSYGGQTDLRAIPLSKQALDGIALHHIDFFAADLSGCTLDRCDMSHCWLSHADLRGTSFNYCQLDNALMDDSLFDNGTSFLGVNLNSINFNLAPRLQASAFRQAWIADMERHSPAMACFLRVTCDYGRSFSRFALWTMGIIFLFAVIYYVAPGAIDRHGFLNCIYFSVVTFTTLGYGDIHPVSSLGIVAVIAEVLCGYIVLGLLVAIFSKKVLG